MWSLKSLPILSILILFHPNVFLPFNSFLALSKIYMKFIHPLPSLYCGSHLLFLLLFRLSIMAPVSSMADFCPLVGVPGLPPTLIHSSCAKLVRFPYTAILEAQPSSNSCPFSNMWARESNYSSFYRLSSVNLVQNRWNMYICNYYLYVLWFFWFW